MEPSTEKGAPGIGVDAAGGAVIDPTANVIALSQAATKRQDDLREAERRYFDAQLAHVREIGRLRAEHQRALDAAETNRLDSIRQVDQQNVNTAAERALAAIHTLAATTQTNAENLRNALNSTATALATQNSASVASITERIAALEKSSYEGKGRQSFADPQIDMLMTEMRKLSAAGSASVGKSAGVSMVAAGIMGGVALVGGILGIAGVLYAVLQP